MGWHKFKPGVPRHYLLLVAGLLWSGVGIMLSTRALAWMDELQLVPELELGVFGVFLALGAWRFMFLPLVRKNVDRLEHAPLRACFFGFQAWKSYGIMAGMILLGVTLRSSSLPHVYLAVMYLAIGGGLFLASLGYYRHFKASLASAP
jgi:hypothetical protein